MSAKLSRFDKKWLLAINTRPVPISQLDEALITLSFDNETDEDIKVIEKELKQDKFLKKVALLKLIMFPSEYVLMLLFFNKEYRQKKVEIINIYLKYYRKQISLNKFKKELNEFLKSGIIV